MFEVIFIISVATYCIQLIVLLIGASKKFPRLAEDNLPTVSVIVAARNEENNILRCMESLAGLRYPEGKLEILIVNDRSTDGTGKVIDSFIDGRPLFRKIDVTGDIGSLRGKSNALACALKTAKGEIILTTDADCAVPTEWAKTLASYYTPGVAVVNGYTSQKAGSAFEGMQNLDFLYLLMVASGTINIGRPISCIGNNMSYRRNAYDEAGGYESLPFCVTEDSQLLLAIARLKKYRLVFPIDKDALVQSLPCVDWLSLFRQKKRWAIGGLQVPLYSYVLLLNAWLSAVLVVLSLFFISQNIAMLIFFRLLLDFTAVSIIAGALNLKDVMKYFAAFEIYLLLYVIVLPFSVLFSRKVNWKGRTF